MSKSGSIIKGDSHLNRGDIIKQQPNAVLDATEEGEWNWDDVDDTETPPFLKLDAGTNMVEFHQDAPMVREGKAKDGREFTSNDFMATVNMNYGCLSVSSVRLLGRIKGARQGKSLVGRHFEVEVIGEGTGRTFEVKEVR